MLALVSVVLECFRVAHVLCVIVSSSHPCLPPTGLSWYPWTSGYCWTAWCGWSARSERRKRLPWSSWPLCECSFRLGVSKTNHARTWKGQGSSGRGEESKYDRSGLVAPDPTSGLVLLSLFFFRANPANKVLLDQVVNVVPPAPWVPLDWLAPLVNLDVR